MSTKLHTILDPPPAGEEHVETNTCPGGVHVSADHLLQLSRRIDWRFLFAAPNLDSVLYLGDRDEHLIEALVAFSKSMCVAESVSEVQANLSPFDVAILKNPSRELLKESNRLLRAGGMLYLEIEDDSKPDDYANILNQYGYLNVRTHWHWPDFETCTAIIPTDDKTVLKYFLRKSKKGIRGLLRSLAARSLFHCGQAHRMFHGFSMTAQWARKP